MKDHVDPELAQEIAIQALKWHKARRAYWEASNLWDTFGSYYDEDLS